MLASVALMQVPGFGFEFIVPRVASLISSAIKVVTEYERDVIFRLGRVRWG